ncbi:MAG: hypothetical protein IPP47_00005 [Bryobacterales bacterium]|nr:hypothetical protein [Bryobacterales bacterium]
MSVEVGVGVMPESATARTMLPCRKSAKAVRAASALMVEVERAVRARTR